MPIVGRSVSGRSAPNEFEIGERQETHDKAAKWAVRANQGIHDPSLPFVDLVDLR
jgi:hypothetical protein